MTRQFAAISLVAMNPMKTRSKIELLVVLTVIVAKCWMLQQQFRADGAVAVILFSTLALLSAAALFRRSSGLAFVLALGSIFSAVGVMQTFAATVDHSLPVILVFTRETAIYLALSLCLLDLWSEWRRSEALRPIPVAQG